MKVKEILAESDLFKLADALAHPAFRLKMAEDDRERLKSAAWAHWQNVKEEGRITWLAYLLRLIFTCPPLLERPPGFEWIMQTLTWELYFRKHNRSADRDFWEAMTKVRARLRRGRPSEQARDFFRWKEVNRLMNEEGLNKTKAVQRVTEQEGGSLDSRTIWKSLERFERQDTARRKRWGFFRNIPPVGFVTGRDRTTVQRRSRRMKNQSESSSSRPPHREKGKD